MSMTLMEAKKYIADRCEELGKRYLLNNVITIMTYINESSDEAYSAEMSSDTRYRECKLNFYVPDCSPLDEDEINRLIDHEMLHCLLYELDWLRRNIGCMEEPDDMFVEVSETLVARIYKIIQQGGFGAQESDKSPDKR